MKTHLLYIYIICVLMVCVSACKENEREDPVVMEPQTLCVVVSNLPDVYGVERLELSLISENGDTVLWQHFDIATEQGAHLMASDTLSLERVLTDEAVECFSQANALYAKITAQDCTETVMTRSIVEVDESAARVALTLSDGWNTLPYESVDYSLHGCVHQLQTHTDGEGIRLVLVGDGFSDRQIASGYYQRVMERAMEMYFGVSPFAEFRALFDVWSIDAVSAVEGCQLDATEQQPNNSAFKTFFGNSTETGGDVYACMEIAAPVLGESQQEQLNSMMVVIMNSHKYAGTTYFYYYSPCTTDFGEGWAFCFLPLAQDDERLARLIHHEANGHGFAKLGDEYLPRNGEKTITDKARATYNLYTSMGWYKNIDVTSEPEEVKWATYINDPDYQDEGIGVYEGANIYTYGFYRPTDTSIMKNNQGEFNAPSREAIWYRIQKLAYGQEREYDVPDFKAWDREHRSVRNCAPYGIKKQEARDVDPELPAPKSQLLLLKR